MNTVAMHLIVAPLTADGGAGINPVRAHVGLVRVTDAVVE